MIEIKLTNPPTTADDYRKHSLVFGIVGTVTVAIGIATLILAYLLAISGNVGIGWLAFLAYLSISRFTSLHHVRKLKADARASYEAAQRLEGGK